MPKKPQLNTESLRAKLKLKEFSARQKLENRYPHIKALLTGGVLAGSLLVASPQTSPILAALPPASGNRSLSPKDIPSSIIDQLHDILPSHVQQLDETQEAKISQLLHDQFGIHAKAELEGNRLNRDYGWIGAEQN